jgi:PAS domain S-box-containing protein
MPQKDHVLIVEDESVNAAVIEHELRKLGYSIAGIATSGEEALDLAVRTKPDIVLMDIALDGLLDGVDAAALIRQRTGVPVVYLTGNSDEQTIERARTTEAFGYLHKPFQEREIHGALQMALYKAEMECRLRDEHKWFVTTLRCITDGVIATDATGAVKVVNLVAEQITGWKEEEALDRDLSEIFEILEFGTRRPAECIVTRLLHGEAQINGTSCQLLVSRGGMEIAIEQNATSIVTDSGDMSGVLVVFRECRGPTQKSRKQ